MTVGGKDERTSGHARRNGKHQIFVSPNKGVSKIFISNSDSGLGIRHKIADHRNLSTATLRATS